MRQEALADMRILIADDHGVVRRGLRELLQSRDGWKVCGEAGDGLKAIALARELEPDIAVLDLAMPLLNGLDATRRIRRAVPTTQILLFTVHASEQLAADAVKAGAAGYVVKSQPAAALLSAVESACLGGASAALRVPKTTGAVRGANGGKTLTAREREIVQLIADAQSNQEIATALGISVKTVESHRAHLMRKLGFTSISALVRYAVRNHLVDA
jgi:DNA-binding NarL/FixJ family response regulator